MKKMPKKLLDELITARREYWETGDKELLSVSSDISDSLEEKTGIQWLAAHNLIDSVFVHRGFCREADNDVIYQVLRVLGWEVTDEDETSESV